MVWLSGPARAICSAAILPAAPGRFSTTTAWPHTSDSRVPRMRAIGSLAPPAVAGTTSRTGRAGHACARTGLARGDTKVAAADARSIVRREITIALSLSLADGDAAFFDHRPPLVHLGLVETSELLGSRADHDHAELLKPPFDSRLGQDRGGVGMHPTDDFGRR